MAYLLIIAGIIALISGILLLRVNAPVTLQETQTSESTAIIESHNTESTVEDGLTDNERKGRQFEEWVVSQFPKPEYTLKEWRGDKYVEGTYAESNRYPDLEIELKLKNGTYLFAVECKYRTSIPEQFEWTSQEKIDIYNMYASDHHIPTFVVFGIGGTPSAPEEVIIVPLNKLQSPVITSKQLRTFHHHDLTRTLYYYAKDKRLM